MAAGVFSGDIEPGFLELVSVCPAPGTPMAP